jgi:FkbM family methyltransferase
MLEKLKFKIRSFFGIIQTLAELEHLENHISHLESKIEANQQYNISLLHELLSQSQHKILHDLIKRSRPGTIVDCWLNNISVLVPIEVLKNYIHCLRPSSEQQLNFLVEIHCSDWLASQLKEGDTFLDVGAAYGVISLPLSQSLGNDGHIYAFEPAIKTRSLLEQLINLNQLKNITVVPLAISDQLGEAEFIEYSADNQFSWAPDTSTLASNIQPTTDNYCRYFVDITTIDDFVRAQNIQPKAIKIDIEGFELYALQGAKETLKSYRPHLCIDIHNDVKTNESSLLAIEPLLTNLGYKCHHKEHTLFASFS